MGRGAIARALDITHLGEALLRAQRAVGVPWITAITYHSAADTARAKLYDDGVVDTTKEQFDEQLAFYTRHFDVIGIDDLTRFVTKGEPLPKSPLLLTFDDGYIDNHDVVLPLLQKHGTRATFFIATDYLAERKLFWWDKINFFVKSSKKDQIELQYPDVRVLPRADDKQVSTAVRACLRIVKDTYDLDLERFFQELARGCDVSLSSKEERHLADGMLMTWDHVRALRRAGMDVQSHTASHRVLQTLSPERLKDELVQSKRVLEDVLREPVVAVSYPVGKPLTYFPAIRRAVRDAGYVMGFSNASGVSTRWTFDPMDIRRLGAFYDYTDREFRGFMAVPWFSP